MDKWKSKKILIVEDHTRGEFYQEYLEIRHSLDVTLIAEADEAVSLLEKETFDLFILDIMMPIDENSCLTDIQKTYKIDNDLGLFSGILLLIKIQEMKTDSPFKTIFFSARSKEKIDSEMKKLNGTVQYDKFVSKEEEPVILYNTIEKLLK